MAHPDTDGHKSNCAVHAGEQCDQHCGPDSPFVDWRLNEARRVLIDVKAGKLDVHRISVSLEYLTKAIDTHNEGICVVCSKPKHGSFNYCEEHWHTALGAARK